MRNQRLWIAVALTTMCLALPVAAQVPIPTLGTPVTQDFNTLATTGTENALTITGWYLTETGGGARDNELYAADTGGGNTGDTMSYGSTGSAERALGGLQSGTLVPTFGAAFANNTGGTITSLAIAYTGEEWRLGATGGRTDRIDFQYSLNATSLTTGTWTDVDALDFTTPNTTAPTGAKNGNDAAYRTALSSTIASLSIANGATFWIRWTDFNPAGADDGLAVDDFSLTANGTGGLPTLSIDDVAQNEGNSGTTTFTFTVTLSAPAGAGGVTFDIATSDGTATAPGDYTANSLTGQTIPAGSSSYTFDVLVNGDTDSESDETFNVTVSSVTGATVSDGVGVGTIQNDDAVTPSLSVNDVTAAEGDSGTTTFTFTVSLSVPAGAGGVSFDIATADGTATQPSDYASNSLTGQTIAEGSSTYTFNVLVNGDETPEPNETFTVDVTNLAGAIAGDPTGLGTITNDDGLEIFQIQGSGAASPYATQTVTTKRNVVTAVGAQGFFIQTPTARDDLNPNTSNGIYVYTGGAPTVTVGNLVNVTGQVVEYFDFTEFSGGLSVTVVGTGQSLPAPIEFNATVPSPNPATPSCTIQYECWEGMLVNVASGITSGPNQYFGTDPTAEIYGVASTSRPFREPGVKYPGWTPPPVLPIWDGNPEVFEIDADKLGGLSDPDIVPAGSTYNATGVLAYEFSGWELWPTSFFFTPPVLPRPVRAPAAGEFTIGTYNLLLLDATKADYTTRLAKHSMYIREVLGAPDVLGVQECMTITELTALAARILADDATLAYTPFLVEGNDIGGIDSGFLVRSTVTNPVVTQLGKDELFSMDGSKLHDRPPLQLEATYAGNGLPFAFTVMVNHTRSLSSIDSPSDGNRVRHKRLEQSQSIASMVQTFQTANPTRPFIMVGDLNAYEISDGYVDVVGQMAGDFVPADNLLSGPDLVNPNLTKQALSVPANDRYSYTYDGTAQVLDHALTSQAADPWVRGFAYGRGNCDSAEVLISDSTSALASSDHDGAVLFMMSDSNGDGVPDDLQAANLGITKTDAPDPVESAGTLTYTVTVSNAGPDLSGPITVTDTLPAEVTFGSAAGTGWTCGHLAGVVTCTRAPLAVGTAPSITITVAVTATSGTLTNTVTVSSTLTDAVSGNNMASATTTVSTATNLVLTCEDWVSEVGTWGPSVSPCGDLTSTSTIATYESASFSEMLTDFTYEVELLATRPIQPTAANSLFVRGTPSPRGLNQVWNSGYAFGISMNGKYSVFRYIGGRPYVIQAWVTPVPQVILGSGLPNILKVEATGGTLTFSINGTPVKTITGQTLLSGRVGLGMVRSVPTSTTGGLKDTLVVNAATISLGGGTKPTRGVSLMQERANEAANKAALSTKPNPLFAGSTKSW